jgi:hypothetical protein
MRTLYKKIPIVLGGILLLALPKNTSAQDSTLIDPPNKARGGSTKMLLAGKAEFTWTKTMTQMQGSPDVNSHTFFPDAFMLMPLVKVNDRLFFDGQIEVDANPANGGGAAINLIEMIAYYRVAPALSIFAGNFSPKYGLYMGVMDDFTNRYCTGPIGMARGPQTQTGFGIQGGIQAGYSKFNYQFYVANGPQVIVDSTTQGNANLTGQLNYGNYTDNNRNKAIGGSIGFLPFSNSSLQVDVSGQMTGKAGNDGTPFENIKSTSFAADLNYYHVFNPIMVRVQAEYNSTTTDNRDYTFVDTTSAHSLIVPSFKNQLSGWFLGATLRASGAQSTFLSNLELGGRVGAYTPPTYTVASTPVISPWGENPETQTTVCLTYWFTWKTPLNLAYDVLKMTNGPTITSYTARFIYFF